MWGFKKSLYRHFLNPHDPTTSLIIQGRGGVGVWGLWGCGGCGGLRTNRNIETRTVPVAGNGGPNIQGARRERFPMAAHLGHDSTKYLYFVFPSK